MTDPTAFAGTAPTSLTNTDGWANISTGLGLLERDKRMSTYFAAGSKISQAELDALYRFDDTVARICELVPAECLREWIDVGGDPESKILGKLDQLRARTKVQEAHTWSRLHGGSVVLLGAIDGLPMWEPLDLARVTAIDWLHVLDRWDVTIERCYTDPANPLYGQPELYRVRTVQGTPGQLSGAEPLVHESRVIRFDGVTTGRRQIIENQGWHDSVVDRVYPIVRDFNAAFDSASNLLTDFAQAVFKIKGLREMLASDTGDKVILRRLQLLDVARSSMRAIPLDADGEEFTREATPITGLHEVLDRICARMSAASGLPITLLMGQAPGGLNASGEGDQRNWHNKVAAEQETRVRPALARLIEVVAAALKIKPDTDDASVTAFPFTFRPLWQPTEKELAETRKLVADTDAVYIVNGVVDPSEIAISRFGGEHYSSETTLDTEARDEQATAADDAQKALEDEAKRTGKPVEGEKAQDEALNGAQMASLETYCVGVSEGKYPRITARGLIELSMPAVAADPKRMAIVDKMLAAIVEGGSKPEPQPSPFGAGSAGAPSNGVGQSGSKLGVGKPAGHEPDAPGKKPPPFDR